ncbi:MAG: hypothetical protein ABMA64_30640 [Myxococcota bacterium]
MPEQSTPESDPSGPYCVVWVYRDAPDAFERAARYAMQNAGYGLPVVIVFTDAGARLLGTDRMYQLLRTPGIAELIDGLVQKKVFFELDIGAARRAGVIETLGALPNLRIADEQRVAELTTGARVSVRY